jgi:WD40 repeat protein
MFPSTSLLSEQRDVALVSCMNGSIYVINIDGSKVGRKLEVEEEPCLKVLQHISVHDKYVIRSCWSSDGTMFASVSNDRTAKLFKFTGDVLTFTGYELVKTFFFRNNPESLLFLPAPHNSLVVVEAGMLHMHYIDLTSFESTDVSINNEEWNTHVSFTIRDLALSPDGKYLMAATDSNAHILYSLKGNKQLKRYVGHRSELYSTPRLLWHPTGKYFYSNSQQDRRIFCWDVVTEKIVCELLDHVGDVKDIDYTVLDGKREVLASCGFDKAVKFWFTS